MINISKSENKIFINAIYFKRVVDFRMLETVSIFIGFSIQAKKMLFSKEPDNFKNLFVPGFDRVFLNDSGFGYSYTVSYRLPLFKKEK